jgi:hypothetical protein
MGGEKDRADRLATYSDAVFAVREAPLCLV